MMMIMIQRPVWIVRLGTGDQITRLADRSLSVGTYFARPLFCCCSWWWWKYCIFHFIRMYSIKKSRARNRLHLKATVSFLRLAVLPPGWAQSVYIHNRTHTTYFFFFSLSFVTFLIFFFFYPTLAVEDVLLFTSLIPSWFLGFSFEIDPRANKTLF